MKRAAPATRSRSAGLKGSGNDGSVRKVMRQLYPGTSMCGSLIASRNSATRSEPLTRSSPGILPGDTPFSRSKSVTRMCSQAVKPACSRQLFTQSRGERSIATILEAVSVDFAMPETRPPTPREAIHLAYAVLRQPAGCPIRSFPDIRCSRACENQLRSRVADALAFLDHLTYLLRSETSATSALPS